MRAHRHPDPARGRRRHGVQDSRAAALRARLYRRRRHLRRRLLRSAQSGRRARPARGVRHRQQRLGDFRAGGAANRRANSGAESGRRPAFRACRSTATTCSRFARWSREALEAARRGGGPTLDRSADLPLERSHHRRRRQPLPRRTKKSKKRGPSSPCSGCARFCVNAGFGMRPRSRPCWRTARARSMRRWLNIWQGEALHRCHVRSSVRRAAGAPARAASHRAQVRHRSTSGH